MQADPNEIQVMTPTRKGLLGVERLNVILQQYLNPSDSQKTEKEINGRLFREGDKVMQIKNNYQLEWEVSTRFGLTVDKGTGVFNGDMGVIDEINEYTETVIVEYDEGRKVKYGYDMTDELELAYAITVHKSQGSEYPAVIIPLLPGPKLLYNRNLLYTAVTRAKKCLTIVGSELTFQEMIENKSEQGRFTRANQRILEKMYPKRCPFCQGISSKGICDDCRKQVVKVGKIKCIHCGKPLEDETKEYCRDCERRKSNYSF